MVAQNVLLLCPYPGLQHYLVFRVYLRGSLHLLPWKLPPTSMEVNQVNQLPWKLPPTFMEFNFLPFTSMEVAMEVYSFSSFIYFRESFHLLASIFHGSFDQFPWKLEIGPLLRK